jgi:hypothetical protein
LARTPAPGVTLDLFRFSSAGFRDFADGRDGVTTFSAFAGGPFHNQWRFGTRIDTGAVGDFDAFHVFGVVQPGNNSIAFSLRDFKIMNALGWTPATIATGPLLVSASGDFDGNGLPDFIWRRTSDSRMGMWSYDASMQMVTTTDLGAIDFNWMAVGSGSFTPGATTQMLMDYVPNGTMTVWWVSNGQLTGINLGQRWLDAGYVATGTFLPAANRGGGSTDFLVSNLTDHHLYDWWVGSNGTLQGIDLGPYWSNVSVVATGQFTSNGAQNLLVSNNLDHHLYDWWIGPNNALQGVDLGPYWSNVVFIGAGNFIPGQYSFLVANTVDHHLYDWWIAGNGTLQGIDLGPVWSNVQLLAIDHFDDNTSNAEILVQSTVDHQVYEWWFYQSWITSQWQLTGIGLGGHPFWDSVELVGHGHYDNNSANSELLVRNPRDGHFYEWWFGSNHQLDGIDLWCGRCGCDRSRGRGVRFDLAARAGDGIVRLVKRHSCVFD